MRISDWSSDVCSSDLAMKLMDQRRDEHGAPSMKLFDDPQEELLLWKVRESGLGATAFVPGEKNTHPGWEDAAVAPDKVGDYLRDFKKLQIGRASCRDRVCQYV